ncbi:MFS transporter [Parachryseolinea silvisoli]|jgi:NNP family nitrate/nitrite transporter-like MFS transporter|uniref:MFS transporter n=1 Tax=Parachryseolinea silvisoli TaxID=2873601 RepID=UPI002265D481|nr:MFS transporter [Parachryseolinea silvisoli]MCD9015772.1 MFS transporter [Parachryseolinea silvisoli]
MSQTQFPKATRINLVDFTSVPMRTFHITWITFFFCFFGWFGIAPLMPVVREDLGLSKAQIGNIIIASVSITIFARLLFGWLCDKIGPRISYSALLILGSIPVMLIGLSNSYESFLLFRLAIGVIGASFVVTQYHTSVMFAPNVVGTANATAAGWGNMGGGVTLMVMPLIFAALVGAGYAAPEAWRYSMIVPGVVLLILGFVYYFCTQDTPAGNLSEIRKDLPAATVEKKESFWKTCQDYRVWVLFLAYGACFGIEITIDNIATLYFVDNFHLGLKEAGLIAGGFGMMNIFARALGGVFGDKVGKRYGLSGRIFILALFLLLEGLGIMLFASMDVLIWAIITMLVFALFLKMSNGATYSVVPFINAKAMGSVSGIVGAGGNVGAVLAGFLFASESISYRDSLFMIGIVVALVAAVAFLLAVAQRAAISPVTADAAVQEAVA